jgi:hypothetical protein
VQAAGNSSAYLIDPALLTIAVSDARKTYDALAYTGGNGIAVTGLVNGDTRASLTGTLVYGGSAQSAVNAGSYDLTASGLANANYAITWTPGTLNVDKALLTVAGSTTQATYTGLVQRNTYTPTGLLGSDSVTGVAGLASGTNAASYTDHLSDATGVGLGNYQITYTNGGLIVDPASLTLTYTALGASSTYGMQVASVTGNVTGAGFVNGEGLAELGGSAQWTTTATLGANVGSYEVTGNGLSSSNYAIRTVQAAGNADAYVINPLTPRAWPSQQIIQGLLGDFGALQSIGNAQARKDDSIPF